MDEYKDKRVLPDVLKKLLLYLRLLGIYCDGWRLVRGSARRSWRVKILTTVTSVLSFFYLLSVWFVEIRLLPLFSRAEMFSTVFLQVCLMFFICLSALWNFSCCFYLVQRHWARIVQGLERECSIKEGQFPLVFRYFGSFLIIMFVLVSAVPMSSLVGLFRPEGSKPPSEMSLIRLYPAKPNTSFWMVMKCFYAYYAFLSYQQVFAYCLTITIICYLLKREFQAVAGDLQKLHTPTETKTFSLEDLRLKHERLCELTEQTDRVIGYVAFGIYFTGILNLCFCLSCLSSDQFPRSQMPTLISLTMAALAKMSSCTVIGVSLNYQAHRPKGILLKFKAGELKREDFQSLSVFLAQVSGQDIGITALGLFTINKSTILTIAGTVITYAVVVQQLNVNTEVSSQLVNSTMAAT